MEAPPPNNPPLFNHVKAKSPADNKSYVTRITRLVEFKVETLDGYPDENSLVLYKSILDEMMAEKDQDDYCQFTVATLTEKEEKEECLKFLELSLLRTHHQYNYPFPLTKEMLYDVMSDFEKRYPLLLRSNGCFNGGEHYDSFAGFEDKLSFADYTSQEVLERHAQSLGLPSTLTPQPVI